MKGIEKKKKKKMMEATTIALESDHGAVETLVTASMITNPFKVQDSIPITLSELCFNCMENEGKERPKDQSARFSLHFMFVIMKPLVFFPDDRASLTWHYCLLARYGLA